MDPFRFSVTCRPQGLMRELGPFRAFSDPAVCRATACRPCTADSWVNAGPTTIRALIAQTISLAGWRSTLCALDARVDSGFELGLPSGDHLNVARLRRTRERAASRPRDEGGSDWPCLAQGKQRPRRSGRVWFLADGGGVLDGGSDRVVPRQTSQVARPGDCGGAVCRQADVSRAVVVKVDASAGVCCRLDPGSGQPVPYPSSRPTRAGRGASLRCVGHRLQWARTQARRVRPAFDR